MENKLKQMFPSGQWGLGQKSWMVQDGAYSWPAADIVDGEIVLTDLGRKLTGAVPKEVTTEEVAVEKAIVTPKPAKKTGLKV